MIANAIHIRRSRAALLRGASAALVLGLALPSAVYAQSAPPQAATDAPAAQPPAEAAPTTSSDIVVTANRREETVQKANQSISAVSGLQLQARGIVSLEQIASEIPGISQKTEGPGQTEYEMRGVSSSGGSAPTVGFYLDDVALTSPAASDVNKAVIDPSLYDLSRVEVLRGPQGTLYGSSSMGGTIRLITNQPDTKSFSATGQVIGSGTDGGGFNYSVNGAVNVPLVEDHLALRIVGTDSRNSGWIDRDYLANFPQPTNNGQTRGNVLGVTPTAIHKNANWEHTTGVRASLLWQPTDNLTITPTALYQNLRQGGQNIADAPPGTSYETHYQPNDVAEPSSDKFELFTLPIKLKVGDVQFESITGYYHRKSSLTEETEENLQDYFLTHGAPFTFGQLGQINITNAGTDSQLTQEFRISSTGTSPFQWLVGAYYQDFTSQFTISSNPANAFVTSTFGTSDWAYIHYDPKIKQYAGFGELSYKLGAFKLTGGLRYYSYTSSMVTYQHGIFFTGGGPETATTTTGKGSATGFIPRVNISYVPSDDLTLYAQAAKGFRPGSALPPAPVACGALPTQYSPDSLWSYEAGEKARLFDRRLTINAAGYYEDWSNIQQKIEKNSCAYNYTSNAGTAHIYGAEAEISWQVTPELVLSTALGYSHARLVSAPAGSTIVVGSRIQEVPDWTNTASIVYTRPLNEDRNLVFRATDEYVGSQTVANFTTDTIPSHNFVNLRLGLTDRKWGGAWLFANNVTNKHTALNEALNILLQAPTNNRDVVPQPRTIGLELDFKFGGR